MVLVEERKEFKWAFELTVGCAEYGICPAKSEWQVLRLRVSSQILPEPFVKFLSMYASVIISEMYLSFENGGCHPRVCCKNQNVICVALHNHSPSTAPMLSATVVVFSL